MKDYSEKRDFYRMQVNSEIEIKDGNLKPTSRFFAAHRMGKVFCSALQSPK